MKHLIFLLSFLFSFNSFAWTDRGHDAICQSAVYLLKEKGLKEFLQKKPSMMGYLCNLPDTQWRNISPDVSSLGNPTHYLDTDLLKIKIEEIPLDYKEVSKLLTGKINPFTGKPIEKIPKEFGSNWWRADQFHRLAIAAGKTLSKSKTPSNGVEEQDDNFPFNKAAYQFLINLGLMGHFVGDNSVPFHNTADYDGYKAHHGGIHAYYEEGIVAAQPYSLNSQIVEQAQKLLSAPTSDKSVRFLHQKNLLANMRALGQLSYDDIAKVYALDPVKKPSTEKFDGENSAAVREPAETVAVKAAPLVVLDLARSAALLAQSWDEAYAQAGRPNLRGYKSFHYPFTVDFIPPDYLDKK